MYSTTIVNWHDLSAINQTPNTESLDNNPLYFTVSSFNRGPEDLRVVRGQTFYDLYGSKMDFNKHGQPALQAANIIDGGGSLLIKRLVAKDSLLANVVLAAQVTKSKKARVATSTDTTTLSYDEAMAALNGEVVETEPSDDNTPEVAAKTYAARAVLANGLEGNTYDLTADVVLETEPTPIYPDASTGLGNLTLTSAAGTETGLTVVTVTPALTASNAYIYKIFGADDTLVFPNAGDTCTVGEGEYTLWDGTSAISADSGQYIVLVEASVATDVDTVYTAVNAGAVVIDAKPETRYVLENQVLTLKWLAVSVTGCTDNSEVVAEAESLYKVSDYTVTEDADGSLVGSVTNVYPLISISDNGRGASTKSVKFTPDLTASKDMSNMFYTIAIYDGTTRIDRKTASLNPYCVINNTGYGIANDTSEQVRFTMFDTMYTEYLAFVVDATGIDEATLLKYDIMFGTTNRSAAIPNFILDEESVDLNSTYGVELQNGSNGEFGDAPFGTEAYDDAAIEVFNGEYDDAVWDVDQYKICAVFDANYSPAIKDVIARFVAFREDCVYFRDLGIDVFSYASISQKITDLKMSAGLASEKDKFVTDYYTTYQIYDPETKKRIRVTMMYDFARVMVTHFTSGPHRPTAGSINGMILSNAIEGTVNFTPRNTPEVNQKQLLDDLRVNYAIFQNGQCVVQSLYTSQDAYTQLSYINNVLGIQDVVRAVRINCPRQRFAFIDGNDFSDYAKAVNDVLKEFKNNYDQLDFDYTQDDLLAAQKIFYGAISFRFKNWAQTEQFDVYALPITEE